MTSPFILFDDARADGAPGRLYEAPVGEIVARAAAEIGPALAALRPTPNIHSKAASSRTTPIPTRAQVGRSDGVTNASVNPANTKITMVPNRTVTARRPSSDSA